MKICNAYFEGLDGFANTMKGADRVRAVEYPQLGDALDCLFAALLERNEDATEFGHDIDYVFDQLQRFADNVKDQFEGE